jgi:hypothetical protein
VVLDELEEGIEDAAAKLARAAIASERIELVEQVNRARLLDGVEDDAELRGGLAHELRDERIEPNREERNRKLTRERGRGHRLACPGRSDQEQLPERGQAVPSKPLALALLEEDAIELQTSRRIEHHVLKPRLRICRRQKPGELSARPAQPSHRHRVRRAVASPCR